MQRQGPETSDVQLLKQAASLFVQSKSKNTEEKHRFPFSPFTVLPPPGLLRIKRL